MRRVRHHLLWALLLAIGCGGGGGSCGGGCASSCLAPIPGGFPADQRQAGAASVELSASGFQLIQTQVAALVQQQLGGSGSALSLNMPCTPINTQIISGVNATGALCDTDGDGQCTAADGTCAVNANLTGVKVSPAPGTNGASADVAVEVDLAISTANIPITVGISAFGAHACGLDCSASFDTSRDSGSFPAYIPVVADVELTIDQMNGDLLTFNVSGLDKITKNIDPNALDIAPVSGGCNVLGLNVTCSVLGSNTVKQLIFSSLLQGQLQKQIQSQLDKVRCAPCDAMGNCPGGATCDSGTNLCFYNKAKDTCPASPLGLQGEVNLGQTLATYGAPPDAALDLYMVAGDAPPGSGPTSTRVQNGGLQVGMLGGTHAPVVSSCVPSATWTPPPPLTPMDFDMESMLAGPGTDLKDYQVGFSLSSAFLNKAAFDAWQSGVICLDVSGDNVSLLTSSLFGFLLPNLGVLTHGQTVPMLLALRPTQAPTFTIGRGDTDPLLQLQMKGLNIDFYAFIEERYVRLFEAQADMALLLSLTFDPNTNSISPVLANNAQHPLISNVMVTKNELNAGKSEDIAAAIPGLIMTAQSQLTGALMQSFSLPSVMGFNVQVLGARGSVPLQDGGGFEHLAIFAKVSTAAMMDTAHTRTTARIVRSFVPTAPLNLHDAEQHPHLALSAQAQSARPLNFAGYEYAYRVDGGLWTDWFPTPNFEIRSPALLLQGAHDIQVRSRAIGHPETVDEEPPHLTFVVDYAPPDVKLQYSQTAQEVQTIAHDAVTADELLTYRYRVAGGEWSAWGPAQAFREDQLGRIPSLEVEVRDQAERVGSAAYGTPAAQLGTAKAPATGSAPAGHVGCSQAGVGLLGLLGLVVRRRARRG